jgi:hypothetical protein
MRMEALYEGILGSSFHGGLMEAYTLIYFWCLFFLEEGALEEEGTHLVGTRYSWKITYMSVSMERYHTRDSLCARDSSLELRGPKEHCFSEIVNKGRGHAKLGCISLIGTPNHLDRSCYCIRFHCIFILVVSHDLDITYIYFHSKLVFPGGFLSRVMLTKNTCVQISCMLSC